MHVIINLAAHNDPCTPNGTNAIFEIDYVKVWDSTTPADCNGESVVITPANNQNNIIHYSNFIQTAGAVIINQTANTLWTAGHYIDLLPGFEVYGNFEANITPCMADCWWCRHAETNSISVSEPFNTNDYYNARAIHSIEDNIQTVNSNFVYQNPDPSSVNILKEAFDEVCIYDLSGHIILPKTKKHQTLDMEMINLASGVYIVKVYFKESVKTKKWVKL